MGVAAGADHMDAFGAATQGLNNHFGLQDFAADDVIYFVQDDEIIFFGIDGVAAGLPTLFRELDIFGIGLRAANFHKAATHRTNFKFVIAQHFGGVEFAIVPRTFYE